MGDFHYEYEMPAMTVDIAVFTERAGDLYLLLIRRGNPPFEGCYALPGGFVEKGETVDEAAARELAEETGVTGLLMDQLRTFSRPGRDPRGWTITTAFYLLADEKDLHVQAGDDARAAEWMKVSVTHLSEDVWEMSLTGADDRIRVRVREQAGSAFAFLPTLTVLESENIAFDHDEITSYAVRAVLRGMGRWQ